MSKNQKKIVGNCVLTQNKLIGVLDENNKNPLYEFYQGQVRGKRVLIGLAFPVAFSGDKNILAAEMDDRLVLNLKASVNKNNYLLGDISSVHYILTKREDRLIGKLINGSANENLQLTKVSGGCFRSKAIKDFLVECK